MLQASLHDHTAGVLRPLLHVPLLTCAVQSCPTGSSQLNNASCLPAFTDIAEVVEPLGESVELLLPQQLPLEPGLGLQLG